MGGRGGRDFPWVLPPSPHPTMMMVVPMKVLPTVPALKPNTSFKLNTSMFRMSL